MIQSNKSGFTIVELLVVIVVIAILASISLVAFNGIRDRARTSAINTSLNQALKKILIYAVNNSDQLPDTLADAKVDDAGSITYQYTENNTSVPKEYCLTATYDRVVSSYISSTSGSAVQSGICPGHNIMVWYELVAGSPVPVSGAVVDTTVFRGGNRSIRLNPGVVGAGLGASPVTVVQGQVYTVSAWMQTDSSWNGTAGNSKFRFGNLSGGALLTACGYNGVKLTWTFVTCSYTIPAGVTGVTISVGNDGTIGNVWLDDLSLSVTGP